MKRLCNARKVSLDFLSLPNDLLPLTYSLPLLYSSYKPPRINASVSMHSAIDDLLACLVLGRIVILIAKANMRKISFFPSRSRNLILPLALVCFFSGGAESAGVFTIVNLCKTVIWPAVFPASDSFGDGGGFALRPGQSAVFTAPAGGWSGRIWARTDCSFDASGNGSCATGSCGTALKCGGSGEPPASLAEFTLASPEDFYDVSLVDGFNLPVAVRPVNGRGNCTAAGCDGDLRRTCPPELAVRAGGRTVGCRSACDVFGTDRYCCRGQFAGPGTCLATAYSGQFKAACPAAYSYAYDDKSSLFTCSGADYVITFCSDTKQQVCSYHKNRLVCSGSGRRSAWPPVMSTMLLLLVLPLVSFALQFSV